MDRKKALEVVRKWRNFCLREPEGEWPSIADFNEPEFLNVLDENEDLEEIILNHWVESSKQRSQSFFKQFQNFCHGKDTELPENRDFIKTFYRGNPGFREACDNDPVVREVIMRWFEEEQEHT